MEDDRTRKDLERLADMYLTAAPGAKPPPPPEVSVEELDQDRPEPVTSPGSPDPGLAGATPPPEVSTEEDDAEEGATPTETGGLRLGIRPEGSHAPRPLLDYEPRTADRGLPRPVSAAVRLASPDPIARVEAVFLGNLPGFGGPWLAQYAHFLADQLGPVIILNVDRDQVDLELVSTATDRGCVEELARAGNVPAMDGLMAALKRLTRPGLPSIGAWLVHLPMPLDDMSMQVAPDLDRWTLICGSDQAAAVGAYRWVKELVARDDGLQDRRIGLMAMGSDRDKALAMAASLSETAASFLETPVGLIGCRKRIEPVHVRVLGSFEADQGVWPQVTAFLADLVYWSDDNEMVDQMPDELVDEPVAETTTATSAPLSAAPEPSPIELAEPAQPEPAAVVDAEPDQGELDLSQFLDSVTAMAARCPYQPHMQVAVDQTGQMHLLLSHRGSAEEVPAAMSDLAQIRTWASQHAKLLQLTWRDGRIDEQAEPVVHLFTEHAKTAAALVAHVDAGTRLHLLQQITVGSQSTWFCTELN